MAVEEISHFVRVASCGCLAMLCFLISRHLSWSRKIPGPWLAKYTSLWYLWQIYKSDFHLTNIKLHRERGNIIQIMPGYFSIDDPTAHKIIYSHGASWSKGDWYDAWHVGPKKSNLFSERDQAKHAVMRRKVAAMYTMTSLVSYEPFVDYSIQFLINHFEDFAKSNSVISLAHWLQCYAFDVIAMITFGERFGFLDKGKDIENLMGSIDFIHTFLTCLGVFPIFVPLVQRLLAAANGRKELYHQRFANDRIAITKGEMDNLPEDNRPIYMVQKLVDAQRSDKTKGITDWDVSATAGANIGAGSDTTAISLSNALWCLYQSPRVLQRLREEIETVGLPAHPNFRTVQRMPYLQAVIKESLRLSPPLGLPLWRKIPRGGAVISGRFFPEGTNVGVNIWVANRNKSVYGADADEFQPERWLEGASVNCGKTFQEESFMSFGLGSRTCIGRNIALLEINKLIPVLVRNYDFEFIAEDGSPEMSSDLAHKNRWFVKPARLQVRVVKRRDIDLHG